RNRIVLATGGGVVLDPDNRAWLRERGRVIYLYATVEQLLTRTAKDRNRPLLQTADPRARLQELLQARDPLYREVADVVVDTGGRSARGAEREILAKIRPGARGRRQARSTQRPRRRNPLNETMVDDEDPGC
ncbi:MAG: shikimate kinase, partial [Gammaproteobacteria bacterium]